MEALSRVVMVLTLLAATACLADSVSTATVTRVAVELEDGSRILGIPSVSSVVIRTSYAVLDIPWSRMLGGKLTDENGNAEVRLRNGDRLTGKWEPSALELAAVFGKIVAGREHIRSFEVSDSGGSVPAGLREGLVLYFSFDRDEGKTVRDQSGKGNNGKVEGAKWTSDGKVGGAYEFRGGADGGDSIVVANSESLCSMQSTRQLTIAVWMKPRSIPREFPDVVCKGGGYRPDAFGGYELVMNAHGDNDLLFQSEGYATDTRNAHGKWIGRRLGRWIHVAFSLNAATREQAFYIDGEDTKDAFVHGGGPERINFDISNDLYIGRPDPKHHPNRSWFDGWIDEVMIFNRALSAAEVKRVYESGKAPGRRGEGE